MTQQFGRTLQLILSSDDGDGIDLGELTVFFTVTKTAGRALNRIQAEVYNLSRDTIARISRELRRIDVLAGYGDAPGMIFSGNISNVFTRQEGPDRITEIFAQDGLRDAQYAIAHGNVQGGTLRDAISLITAQFEEVKVDLDSIPNVPLAVGDGHFMMAAQKALDRVSESYGLRWMIIDNQLRVFGPDESDGADAIVVNYETGLIGSPVSSRNSLEFTALLNPALRPLGLVEVSSATGVEVQENDQVLAATDLTGVLFGLQPGIFRISEVAHVGETRGQQWYSKVTCHPFVTGSPSA